MKKLSVLKPPVQRLALLFILFLLLPLLLWSQTEHNQFDVLIQNGNLYDGSGNPPMRADVGIKGDRIEAIGKLERESARTVIEASGLAVAPGFINMLSWSVVSLIV